MVVLSVLNPVAQQRGVISARSINPRPSGLDGLKVGLLWSGTAMGDVALGRIEEMLHQRADTVKTKLYRGGLPAPEEILERVAAESDVVIGATAD